MVIMNNLPDGYSHKEGMYKEVSIEAEPPVYIALSENHTSYLSTADVKIDISQLMGNNNYTCHKY